MKHVAFAKLGKSIKFTTSYSPIGGDNEAPAILQALANNNPDITYHIVGRSDFKRLSQSSRIELFPYNNVIDAWADAPSRNTKDKNDYDNPFYHWIGTYFESNNITPDSMVMIIGQVGTVTIPGIIERIADPTTTVNLIDMVVNYTSPITTWLVTSKIPYIEIINDPRYTCSQARDIFHLAKESLSQYDYTYTHRPIYSLEDQTRHEVKIKAKYAGMETGFCVGRDIPTIHKIKKSRNFDIVLNEGNPSRYNMLKEWVLDNIEDVNIYGKWSHELAQHEKDDRFKGSVKLEELVSRMRSTKYTFIIPIAKGWVTSKYLEMIHSGVIPFFHPTYDDQKHIDVPEILRPKTPMELLESIEHLNDNENARIELLKDLQKRILKPELYDGSKLSETIMNACARASGNVYEVPDLSKFKKTEAISLDEFF